MPKLGKTSKQPVKKKESTPTIETPRLRGCPQPPPLVTPAELKHIESHILSACGLTDVRTAPPGITLRKVSAVADYLVVKQQWESSNG